MLKKLIVVAVVAGVAVAAVKGTRWASYVRSEIKSIQTEAEDEIPLDKRVAMLEDGVNRLDRHVLKKVNEVARAKAELSLTEQEVTAQEARQTAKKKVLNDRLAVIRASNTGTVTIGTDTMAVTRAVAELDAASKLYEANQKVLSDLQSNRDNQRQSVSVLDEQLNTLIAQRDEMRIKVRSLKVEVQKIHLQQMKSRTPAGDTELANVKQEFREIERKLLTEQERLKLLPRIDDDTEVTPPPAPTSLDTIEGRLNGPKPELPKASD